MRIKTEIKNKGDNYKYFIEEWNKKKDSINIYKKKSEDQIKKGNKSQIGIEWWNVTQIIFFMKRQRKRIRHKKNKDHIYIYIYIYIS